MDIRIDELGAAVSAQADHVIPAMRANQTVKLTAEQLATFIIAIVTDSAPATLDTLNELAAALGNDPNFATTVTNALAAKADDSTTNINGLTAKTTPVDADVFRLADSAASFGFKKLTFGNLWTWIKSKISAEVVTPWVVLPSANVSSALQGFGTATGITFRTRRNGGNLEVLGRFLSGTSTAVEARVPIGFNGTVGNVTINSFMNSSIFVVGSAGINIAGASDYMMLATGGNSYLRIGVQNAGREGLTPVDGNVALPASGNSLAFFASVPIEGWS